MQEITTNTIRHSQADNLWTGLAEDDDVLRLEARDDGWGAARIVPGHGLNGLRERVESLGGRCRSTGPPGSGCAPSCRPGRRSRQLTPRETEVLRLLASGFSNREIAEALFLAEGTVKNHISTVLAKLGVKDRTRAVLRALHLGLLSARGGR